MWSFDDEQISKFLEGIVATGDFVEADLFDMDGTELYTFHRPDNAERQNFPFQLLLESPSVDKTFKLRDGQLYTAVNSQGFEVDILRREVQEQDPHPAQLSDTEEDFWVVQARNAEQLVSAPRFSSVVVAANGTMARMNTVHPLAFVRFKRWLAQRPDRDPLKVARDKLQADTVVQLVDEYLPQLSLHP